MLSLMLFVASKIHSNTSPDGIMCLGGNLWEYLVFPPCAAIPGGCTSGKFTVQSIHRENCAHRCQGEIYTQQLQGEEL